jgi:hypothetical protein
MSSPRCCWGPAWCGWVPGGAAPLRGGRTAGASRWWWCCCRVWGLEIYYALAFHQAVEGRTTGDDGVWFATAHEARFRRINRVTALANVPLCAFVAALLGWVAVAP